jgi:hypothetical protein
MTFRGGSFKPYDRHRAGAVPHRRHPDLVIESVRPDAKHPRSSTVPAPVDGVGGSPIDLILEISPYEQGQCPQALASPASTLSCAPTSKPGFPLTSKSGKLLSF